MNEAALILYATTAIASASLGWNSFKHRFLPVARPLAFVAYLLALFTLVRFVEQLSLEMNPLIVQGLSTLFFLLLPLVTPVWVWLLIEYHKEDRVRITDKRIVIFLIHPLVLYVLVFSDILTHGFLSQANDSAVIEPIQRIGDYATFREAYGWAVVLPLFVIIAPYLMIKKQQKSFWNITQIVIYTALPITFFALHHKGVMSLRLAAPTLVIYLYWISRQYRLLDVMPVALKNIIDDVDSGILVSDQYSKLLYVNDYANQFLDLQLSAKDLKLRKEATPDIFKLRFDFSSPEKQVAQLDIKTTHNVKESGEHRNDKQVNKTTRYLDATLQPIFSPESNKHLGSTVVLHDVTQRKLAELELQSFDRQKSEFFAGISHEFRTPLTLSLGNLDDVLDSLDSLLESEADVDKVSAVEMKDSLSHVKSNNNRLLNLVNQLLELSRLNAGSLQIQPVLLHLDTALPRLMTNFESLADKHSIRIHVLFDEQTTHDSQLYFDLDAFEKVIINLISNALKSMPNGGDVYVQINSMDDHYYQLSVRDTGCGIPEDALSKVFEMFYSHQSENTAWPQGVGVGLSLVKQLLNLHDADIEVNSVVDEGTIFTIKFRKGFAHFPDKVRDQIKSSQEAKKNNKNTNTDTNSIGTMTPLTVEDENAAISTTIQNTKLLSELAQENSRDRSTENDELVLLVEDNTEMRAYIRKHLTPNFRLLEAADGKEGLALALQTTPDLILSDVMMPKMNGYDLCKRLKTNAQTSHIPVLLLTAKSAQSDKLEGLELGADDFLAKPFDVKELTLRMRNLIASRHIIKQFYQSNGLQKVIDNSVLPKREKSFLYTLRNYVQENISKTDIHLSDLAKAVHMSERSLGRKLKALTGDTPKQMLITIRLEYATELLRQTNETISQLSYSAGFSDASHFTRSFKAHYSLTPSEYRKQTRKK